MEPSKVQPAYSYASPDNNPSSYGVVTTQPAVMQTNVIIGQQQQRPLGAKPWDTGLCSCFDDITSCCCVMWCGNFYYATLAARMGENCCVGCSGYAAGCVPGGHMAMRTAIRNKHGIQGDICGDCCTIYCCTPCAMCQLKRQMDILGYA